MRMLSRLVVVSFAVVAAGCVADEAVADDPLAVPVPVEAQDPLCDAELEDIVVSDELRPDRPAKLLDPGGVPDIGEPDPRDPEADCAVTGGCTMRTIPTAVVDDDDRATRGCLRAARS